MKNLNLIQVNLKKTTAASVILLSLLLLNNKPVAAQNQQGQTSINVGVGASTIFTLFSLAQSAQPNATYSYAITPAYTGTIDYAIGNVFSMGLAVGYQADVITYSNYVNSQTGLIENVTENISRLNVGARFLFHFTHGDRFDAYSGIRIGLSHWNSTDNSNDTNFSVLKGNVNLPSFQMLYGMKYYLTDNIGLHLELAIGTPYFIEGGVSFLLGGNGGGRK